jgi:predicted transcriptional regulator
VQNLCVKQPTHESSAVLTQRQAPRSPYSSVKWSDRHLEATVKRAADWLRAKNIGSVVVTSGNSILGVISEREIVHALSQFGEQVASMTVKDIMRHGLVTVAPEDDLSRVMKLMTRHRVRHMPVLRDGKLCGIISIGDVVKHRLDDLELEANILRDAYIAHH